MIPGLMVDYLNSRLSLWKGTIPTIDWLKLDVAIDSYSRRRLFEFLNPRSSFSMLYLKPHADWNFVNLSDQDH